MTVFTFYRDFVEIPAYRYPFVNVTSASNSVFVVFEFNRVRGYRLCKFTQKNPTRNRKKNWKGTLRPFCKATYQHCSPMQFRVFFFSLYMLSLWCATTPFCKRLRHSGGKCRFRVRRIFDFQVIHCDLLPLRHYCKVENFSRTSFSMVSMPSHIVCVCFYVCCVIHLNVMLFFCRATMHDHL